MFFTKRCLLTLLVATGATIVPRPAVAFTTVHSVYFSVSQLPSESGGSSYGLGGGVASTATRDATLIAPDGTEFSNYVTTIHRSSFSEIGTLLFGQWLIKEHLASGADVSYGITISPFGLADVLAETPLITSPLSGSTVAPNFKVQWQYAMGTPLPSISIEHEQTNIATPVQFSSDTATSIKVVARPQSVGPASITLRVGNSSYLNDHTSLTIYSPELVNGTFHISQRFDTLSLPATYNVIPEPTCLCMAIIAITTARAMRRSR